MKKAALNAIDLIKEKLNGKVKGRTVAAGRKQRLNYEKSDVSSPALSQDSFLLSLVTDAMEGRHIATADIIGAFLKADQKDFVLVRLHIHAVDALLNIHRKKYESYVTKERGIKVLYVRLLKTMYEHLPHQYCSITCLPIHWLKWVLR